MKLFLLLLSLLMMTPASAETIIIENAHLIDGIRDLPNTTIRIENGRIRSINGKSEIPNGATVINANGNPVTPSLYAAAAQIGIVEQGSASDTDDTSVKSGPLGAAYQVAFSIDPNTLPIQEARAQGVARAMVFPSGGNDVFAGTGALIYLRPGYDILARKEGAIFTGGASATSAAGSARGAVWSLIRNALDEARNFRNQKYTIISTDELNNRLELAALRQVLTKKMPLAIWANREIDIRRAADLARDYDINVIVIGGAEAWRATDALLAAKIPVVIDPLDELPTSYEMIGARRDNAARLAKAGVPFAFMVSGQGIYLSYNVGPALREGAGIAVANGLAYADAIRAITSAPAKIWSDQNSGELKPGVPADLVIWDGDPLEPSSAPAHVFIAGQEISRTTRQTLLRDRYAPAKLREKK